MPENFNGHSFDVPGTFDERLTAGAARLEQEAAVRSPAGVRARGDQRRRRHTATMAVAPVLVLAIAGAAGLTLRPSGSSHHGVGGETPTSSIRTSSGGTAPATPSTSTTSTTSTTSAAAATVTVDLGRHTMTVHDAQGKAVRTLPITAGKPGYATKTGTFTVVDKEQTKKISSVVDGDNYDMTVADYIDLGPQAPAIYAAPWRSDIGQVDSTHGDIGLNPGDAAWLYGRLTVGDKIRIEGATAQ